MKSNLLKAGVITGTLDILLAFANAWWSSGISPERVLRFIASGLTGEKAFEGSFAMVFLGLGIHFFIAFFWTAVFFLLYPAFKNVLRSKFLQGVFYGVFIWVIMNLLVLPLTHVPKPAFQWLNAVKGMGILILAVGFPLAYFAHLYYPDGTKKQG